jgi:hypothetical protein
MPIEQITKKTLESKIDPIAEKQQVFKKIAETFPEYRELINHTEANPIAFVFQHSVADGLELAKKLGLTPEEIRKVTIENPGFVLNHNKVSGYTEGWLWSNSGLSVDENIQFKNIITQARNINATWGNPDAPEKQAAQTFFEASYEKRKNEIGEFPKETINSIADYYAEFLPYRSEKLGNPKEIILNKYTPDTISLLNTKLDQGKKVLFPKYIEALTNEIVEKYPEDNYKDALLKMEIPAEEAKFIIGSLRLIKENSKYSTEALPTLVMKLGIGGNKTWNLDATRKPVARIREKIIEHDMTKLTEDLAASALGYGGSSSHYNIKIGYDETLRQHVINKELKESDSSEEIQEALFKGKKMFQEFDVLFKKYNVLPETLGKKNFSELQTIIEETLKNNEDFKHETDSIEEFHDERILKNAELPIQLELFSGIQSNILRKSLEYQAIQDRISEKQLKGIAQFLYDASEQKVPSTLTEDDIGKLFILLEDEMKKDFPYFNTEIKTALQQLDCLKNPDVEHLNQYFVPKSQHDLNEEHNKRIKETKTGHYAYGHRALEMSYLTLNKISLKRQGESGLLESFSTARKAR